MRIHWEPVVQTLSDNHLIRKSQIDFLYSPMPPLDLVLNRQESPPLFIKRPFSESKLVSMPLNSDIVPSADVQIQDWIGG